MNVFVKLAKWLPVSACGGSTSDFQKLKCVIQVKCQFDPRVFFNFPFQFYAERRNYTNETCFLRLL